MGKPYFDDLRSSVIVARKRSHRAVRDVMPNDQDDIVKRLRQAARTDSGCPFAVMLEDAARLNFDGTAH